MDCAQCGEANRDGARFCGACGAPLALRCANCNAELNPKLKFCDECGTPVTGVVAPRRADSDATATRKIVTVLFADLGGSTSFGERTDPEIARVVMAQYHALLQAAIDAHAGTVAKFMGDGMMATFGIPEIAEDDAIRAVRAAMALKAEWTRAMLSRDPSERLQLRVGLNTGKVLAGTVGSDARVDYTAIGEPVNIASWLCSSAKAGRAWGFSCRVGLAEALQRSVHWYRWKGWL